MSLPPNNAAVTVNYAPGAPGAADVCGDDEERMMEEEATHSRIEMIAQIRQRQQQQQQQHQSHGEGGSGGKGGRITPNGTELAGYPSFIEDGSAAGPPTSLVNRRYDRRSPSPELYYGDHNNLRYDRHSPSPELYYEDHNNPHSQPPQQQPQHQGGDHGSSSSSGGYDIGQQQQPLYDPYYGAVAAAATRTVSGAPVEAAGGGSRPTIAVSDSLSHPLPSCLPASLPPCLPA